MWVTRLCFAEASKAAAVNLRKLTSHLRYNLLLRRQPFFKLNIVFDKPQGGCLCHLRTHVSREHVCNLLFLSNSVILRGCVAWTCSQTLSQQYSLWWNCKGKQSDFIFQSLRKWNKNDVFGIRTFSKMCKPWRTCSIVYNPKYSQLQRYP